MLVNSLRNLNSLGVFSCLITREVLMPCMNVHLTMKPFNICDEASYYFVPAFNTNQKAIFPVAGYSHSYSPYKGR